MAGFRLIDSVKPFLPFLPEVELPYEKLQFDDRVLYTVFISLVYLFAQLPLAGIEKDIVTSINDPIYFLRSAFAAEPRSLLEFGIFPIISSALIMQLLSGLKIIKVNFKLQKDRELFQSFTKLITFIQYFFLTNIFILAGYYGTDLTIFQVALLNFQLVGAGVVATLLIEIIDKGFGFTSGPMIINTVVIATNTIADIIGVSQIKIDDQGNTEAQGALINLVQGFRAKHKTLVGAVVSAFNRDYLPNLTTAVLVLTIGAIVCYFQNFRVELPIRSTRARGMNNVYPVRLFHVASLSVSFSYTLLFYIHITAFTLITLVGKNDPSNIVCKILGHYNDVNNILAVPTFPLSVFTPPRSFFGGLIEAPLSFVVFPAFVLVTGVWFAYKWQAISGQSAYDLAKEFKEQGLTLAGRREQNVGKELDKSIPLASATGAAVLAIITIAGELLGLKGKAASMVIGVCGGFSLLELITLEYQQAGGNSALSQVLGNPTSM
ncbi:sec sixty-one protein homolog [Monosporozyma servazzii]